MKTITLTIMAMSPLSHGAFSDAGSGNAMQFRREPILSITGTPRVPVISGNSIRGTMRRFIMRELLASAGVTAESLEGKVGKKAMRMFDRLYAALAQGGTIEEMEASVSPSDVRALRSSLPPLSLFGAALYNSLLPGMMSVGFAYPVCKQTVEAGLVQGESSLNAEELISDTGLMRHIDREIAEPEHSGVTPMPYTVEVLAIGTVLQSRIKTEPHTTPIEMSCLAHAIKSLEFLGGKKGTGFGSIKVATDTDLDDSAYLEWLTNAEVNQAALLALGEQVA